MSEKNKNTVKSQEEEEKNIPETEPVKEEAEIQGGQENAGDTQEPETETEKDSEEGIGEDSEKDISEDSEKDIGEETGNEPQPESKKTSFFGKKKKEKDKFEQQIEELTDRLKRTMAEFDNFRKRTEKEKASMYVIGAREIVEKILPIVDNFERGLDQAQEGDPFADGMKMIYKQLMTTLDELGVKPIEAVGKEFDPNLHNAVMHVEDEKAGDNIVVEELQKGYTYKDFVVRHSMVKVAN